MLLLISNEYVCYANEKKHRMIITFKLCLSAGVEAGDIRN